VPWGSSRFRGGSTRVPRRHATKNLPLSRIANGVPAGQKHKGSVETSLCRRLISALWLIVPYGAMGSIPPPTSTPIWSRVAMSARSGRALQLAGRHPRAGLVGALVDPGDHGSSSTVPAPRLNRPVQRCVEFGPGDTGSVIRTAQVTGLFDLSPSSLPCRQVHEGPQQVHRRSVRGQRILAQRRPARSRFIRGQSLHSAGHAQARRARPAARRGSANDAPRRHATKFRPVQGATSDISRILATARGFLEPCRLQRRTTTDLPGAWRALHPGRSAIKSRSKRFGEPLAPA
jgi:hypothetical protein